jgi:Domain of unknown function (DUF4760)
MTTGGVAKTSPGEIVEVRVVVTASILLLISVVALTCIYVKEPTWQPGIRFFGGAAGVAAGILSAYYVGRGLKVTIEQRDRALKDDKITTAFDLARCWNDPNLTQLRAEWRGVLDEVDGKTGDEVCEILRDRQKRTVATDVLNFFEELAYAARSETADIETLRNILRSIVERYYSAMSPWIDRHRRDKHQPTAFEHLEWLRNQWKQ